MRSRRLDAVPFLVGEMEAARATHAGQRQAQLAGDEKEAYRLWLSNARRLRNVWRLLKEINDARR